MKIITTQPLDKQELQSIDPEIEILQVEADALMDSIAGADVLIGNPRDGRYSELLKRAPELKWIHVSAAGVDKVVLSELAGSGVTLTCAKGEVVGSLLAEHAFALLLSLTRGVARLKAEGGWKRSGSAAKSVMELRGKTMGIIGFGGTGRELTARAKAFGMRVLAVRRRVSGDESPATVWPVSRLYDLLEESDIVISTAPWTPDTDRMLDEAAFSHLREGALFINVGRGRTVDTDALVKALESGKLGGAGLDVVDPEPLPDDHPLWKFAQVVITPHIAGNSPDRKFRNRDLILSNFRRLCEGKPLEGQVDLSSGY